MEYLYSTLAFMFFIILILKFVFTGRQNLPPSPFAIPIIGHLHLIKQPLHRALETLLSQYGPIVYLRFGSRNALVVSSPAAIEECFTKNDVIFANRPRSMAGDHFTYNYTAFVWAPYGRVWRNLRRFAAVEIFSPNSLQKSFPILEDEVRLLLRHLFKHSTDGNREVELKTLFALLIVNFMMRIVAGKRGTEEEAADMEVPKKFLLEFKEIFFPGQSMNICDFFPILRLIGYKGIEKNIRRLQERRDEYLQNLIDDIRSKRTSSFLKAASTRKMSLIETLLSLQESEPDFYSDDVTKSTILMMFVAGVETTTIALESSMTLLLNHPEVLRKVKAEIDSNVGCDRMLNDLDLVNLPYLRCVINEILRLYPPVPLLLPHLSSDDCTVGGYHIPRGTMLIVNTWAMHMDPNAWEEPTKFKPERFEAIFGEPEGYKYIPFGMGRRACPGATMAIRTVSFALGSLIQCFEWEKMGQEADNSQDVGISQSKAKPLVAMCSVRPNMIELLSQL